MQGDWQSVRTLPPLEADELQLWQVQLGDLPGDPETSGDPNIYRRHLSATEQDRANRLRPGQVRMQFVVARSCLRILLGSLLDLPPGLVSIGLSSYGKPQLPRDNQPPLFFNLAHSRETILIALCRTSVGIDVEYQDRAVEALDIARTSFTAQEALQIEHALNPEERRRLFFRCWTRKEAVLKFDGRGLSLPLTSIEVPVLSPALATPVIIREQVQTSGLTSTCSEVTGTCFVTDLPLGQEVAGAVATSVPNLATRLFKFPLELLATTQV